MGRAEMAARKATGAGTAAEPVSADATVADAARRSFSCGIGGGGAEVHFQEVSPAYRNVICPGATRHPVGTAS